MEAVTREISTRGLRSHLSDVVGRVSYGGERIGVTRNGRLVAVVISVGDAEALEAYETAQDIAAAKAWVEADRPSRPAGELRKELGI
ncbi:type II toxin-antitoxin system Phd/YefM family antitoxin [Arthrobacter sp. efr-133-TYG-120]|uniref:type II toxin-antitoxin system Phd/YefM family antitoxin n=1 Tax=Arthrobacter sp. efr-133-TYG-120 TaxID=3040280 RepID=UPI00254A3532|nr:type II toxin-antitoxin system Phd/YefM family antitoxin [Arthrobacter sp. efr-133-TYG-120]